MSGRLVALSDVFQLLTLLSKLVDAVLRWISQISLIMELVHLLVHLILHI